MLHKLLKVHKLARPSHPTPPKPPASAAVAAAASAPDDENSSALKIVHAGGNLECYFMPIPAVRIIEKYPSFYVTRPEVFRRPWEAVVGPGETLALGEKYYLVPRHTVNKLRRRTRRPSRHDDRSADFGTSQSSDGNGTGARRKDGDSSGSFARRGDQTSDESDVSADIFKTSRRKSSTGKKHVSFQGIDEKPAEGPPPPPAAAAERKHGKVVEKASKGRKKKSQSSGEKRKVKVIPTWQPALASISEVYGSDD